MMPENEDELTRSVDKAARNTLGRRTFLGGVTLVAAAAVTEEYGGPDAGRPARSLEGARRPDHPQRGGRRGHGLLLLVVDH